MRYLTLAEVVELHRRLLQATGGAPGIRDLGALESAIAQPRASLSSMATSVLAMPPWRRFLALNGVEIEGPVGDQERLMVDLASGRIERTQLAGWLRQHLKPLA